jgi:hypothetical protein
MVRRGPLAVLATGPLMIAVLTGCSGTSSCGDAAADFSACVHPAHRTANAGALPTFSDGVGMSEWLMYRRNDVRALSYSPRVMHLSAIKNARIDALEVEECAPLKRSSTISHRRWTVADASGDRLGRLAGKLVDGKLTEDPPLKVSAGDCVKTVLAVAVPEDAQPATAHDGPVDTWVLPGD